MKAVIRITLVLLVVLIGIFVLVQFLPFGKPANNPPVTQEPVWDSPETRQLAAQACFDCHSNETDWPWYSRIAPVSWLIANDVKEGRRALNFSEWGRSQEEGDDLAEVIFEGEMPPSYYIILNPDANLSGAEKQALTRGLSMLAGVEGEFEEDD